MSKLLSIYEKFEDETTDSNNADVQHEGDLVEDGLWRREGQDKWLGQD